MKVNHFLVLDLPYVFYGLLMTLCFIIGCIIYPEYPDSWEIYDGCCILAPCTCSSDRDCSFALPSVGDWAPSECTDKTVPGAPLASVSPSRAGLSFGEKTSLSIFLDLKVKFFFSASWLYFICCFFAASTGPSASFEA